MMHRTRIVVLSTLLLTIFAVGPAVADQVAVSGEIEITNNQTTVIAETGSGQTIDFNPNSKDGIINFNSSEGDIRFDGSNASSAKTFIGQPFGIDNLNSGDVEFSSTQTTKGFLKVDLEHRKQFAVKTGNTNFIYEGANVGGSVVEIGSQYEGDSSTFRFNTSEINQRLLVVDGVDLNYFDTNITNDKGEITTTVPNVSAIGDPNIGETVYLKKPEPITINNIRPKDGAKVSDTAPEVTASISSPDFKFDGYGYTTVFTNEDIGSNIVNETKTSNGNVSGTATNSVNGINNWSINVETTADVTKSVDLSYFTPDELTIRNGSQPSQILTDNVSFTVRFISNDEIIERTTSSGSVSLAGLNRSKQYIVTVRPNDNAAFVYRRIIVDNIGEEASVYLLKDSTATSSVKFELDDPTGTFAPSDTRLYVEKPITRDFDNNGTKETKYQVVAGDVFGSSGSFPMIVENGQRYRLRVESTNSDESRVLGAYSTNNPEVVPIQIEEISPSGDVDGGRVVYGGVEGEQVVVRYLDPTDSTQSVEYAVTDDSGNTTVPLTTRNSQKFADFYDLPAGENASYTVYYKITRKNGATTTGSFDAGRIVGGVSERLDTNPDILELVSYVLIIASMGLVVLVNASLAPLTGTGVATLLTVFGTVAIPAPILGVAGAISVLLPIGRR